jgi:hypothetical protein
MWQQLKILTKVLRRCKSYLNKLGLATVKLGKGDKNAIAEIQKIVTDSKEKMQKFFQSGRSFNFI